MKKFQYIIVYKKELNETKKDSHLIEEHYKRLIPAFNYVLHLPRSPFDLVCQPFDYVEEVKETKHIIKLITSDEINTINLENDTILIVHEQMTVEEIRDIENYCNPFLSSVSLEEINEELLRKHWREIHKKNFLKEYKRIDVDFSQYKLVSLEKLKYISVLHLFNQENNYENYIKLLEEKNIKKREAAYRYYNYYIRALVKTLNEVQGKGNGKDYNRKIFNKNLMEMRGPVVVSLNGNSNFQKKRVKKQKIDSQKNEEIVEVVSALKGIAKNAIIMNKKIENYDLFISLNNLEEHCKKSKKKQNYNYVWKELKSIGQNISKLFIKEEIDYMKRATEIIMYSNFPIGIGILEDEESPLSCIAPISYKPLSLIKNEFEEKLDMFLGSKVNILIVECIDEENNTRKYSDLAWKSLIETLEFLEMYNIQYCVVNNHSEFINEVNKRKNVDIMIVSAHGYHSKVANHSGINIGKNDKLHPYNIENLKSPPIVLLSACHTSPRGDGCITIADLFIERGAWTVLGTCVPIDVFRNLKLYTRLLVNMSESRRNKQQITLLELWNYVLATQAIEEIIDSSKKLKKWANSKCKINKTVPILEFKLQYQNMKLRNTHIYYDSIKKLIEIGKKYGKEEYIESVIKARGYFPESIFYQLIGDAEKIWIYSELIN